jgi:hypothetical protein
VHLPPVVHVAPEKLCPSAAVALPPHLPHLPPTVQDAGKLLCPRADVEVVDEQREHLTVPPVVQVADETVVEKLCPNAPDGTNPHFVHLGAAVHVAVENVCAHAGIA